MQNKFICYAEQEQLHEGIARIKLKVINLLLKEEFKASLSSRNQSLLGVNEDFENKCNEEITL